MARSSECTDYYAQKVLDGVGIVRHACFRQLKNDTSRGCSVAQDGFGFEPMLLIVAVNSPALFVQRIRQLPYMRYRGRTPDLFSRELPPNQRSLVARKYLVSKRIDCLTHAIAARPRSTPVRDGAPHRTAASALQ